MSPATLKRKLHKHGTHYQEQRDLVRKHVALYLYRIKGYSNEEVAAYLHFHDATNFRRSFKRWTGLSPSALRQLFGA
ncbi:HTH-type transcriptional regulator GadX [compost metagenome]